MSLDEKDFERDRIIFALLKEILKNIEAAFLMILRNLNSFYYEVFFIKKHILFSSVNSNMLLHAVKSHITLNPYSKLLNK